MATIANPSLEAAEQAFKSLVWDTAVQAGLTYLFAAAPYLNIWPLRQIIVGLANLVSSQLFEGVKLSVDLQAIRLINGQAQKQFEAAQLRLRLIAMQKGADSKQFKEATEDAKRALSDFLRFGATR